MNLNTIFSLQNIEDPSNYHKVSILRNSSKYLGVSSHLLDPNNSLRNNNKKTRFREDLVEIKEVESFKDFNYEHTYNVDNAQCKCECLLI